MFLALAIFTTKSKKGIKNIVTIKVTTSNSQIIPGLFRNEFPNFSRQISDIHNVP